MKRSVRFLPEALVDLLETRYWYASREPGLGQTFAEAIAEAVERIVQDPALFPLVYGKYDGSWCGSSPMPSISRRWAMKSWFWLFMGAKIPGAGKAGA